MKNFFLLKFCNFHNDGIPYVYRIFPISCSRHFLYGIPFSKVIQSHLEVLGFKIVACCCLVARPEKKFFLLKRGVMQESHGMLLFHCEAWKKYFLLKRGVMMKQLQSRFRLLSCIPVSSCNYFSNILFCNLAFSWYHFSNSASFLYSSLFM